MTKLNKTEIAAINEMIKTGFTFYGDAMFDTFNKAKRCLDGLVRKGFAIKDGGEFKPTAEARDFVKYAI